MSSAEHVIESLILGMRDGRTCEDILKEPVHQANLGNCWMTDEEATRIAVHVVYGLYDGRFPDQNCENCESYASIGAAGGICGNPEAESPFCARYHWCKLFKERQDQ